MAAFGASPASALWMWPLSRLETGIWRGSCQGTSHLACRRRGLAKSQGHRRLHLPPVCAAGFSAPTKAFAAASDVVVHSPELSFCVSGVRPFDQQSAPEIEIEYGRLLPCPPDQLPPRVEHLIFKQTGNVVDVVSESLSLPHLYVEDLIDFGALHYALLCPAPPPTATAEQFELYKQFSLYHDRTQRPSLRGKTVKEAQKTHRVMRKDQELEKGCYLRVHVHPKRFPRCYTVDWKPRLLAETKSYVVLDKPAGVSVGGTVDNLQETCATFAARALGRPAPLHLTHQIDTCTEGCVVLAKTKEFASKFHELLRDRKVGKVYCALSVAPVPIGVITHYMRVDRLPPRLVSKEPHSGWQLCKLEVLDCKRVPWPSVWTMKKFGIRDCGWKTQNHAYESTLRLLTGRTHQVRAQFAALDAPLVGDSMYTPATIGRLRFPDIDPLLDASTLDDESSWEGNIADRRESRTLARWVAMHGREPDCGLGLQASHITWEDDKHYSYRPGPPWWQL